MYFLQKKKKVILTDLARKAAEMLTSEGLQTERNLGNSGKIFLENKLESDNKFLLNHVLDVFLPRWLYEQVVLA